MKKKFFDLCKFLKFGFDVIIEVVEECIDVFGLVNKV